MSLIMTASGLQYADLTIGDGAEAAAGQFVSVHYTGWLQNEDGVPAKNLIPAWIAMNPLNSHSALAKSFRAGIRACKA